MIARILGRQLEKALARSASVVLIGPRQVGKITLAIEVAGEQASVYLDLENPLDKEKIGDIISFYELNRDRLIVLDEVQRLPEVFAPLRGIIDRERRSGNRTGLFLFLGSASLDLLRQSSESLAGRISYLELFPINALEYEAQDAITLNQLWLRGGFPESLLAASDADSLVWRRDFIKTYLERDIPQLGPRIPVETLDRFWTMLAHHQGAPLNASVLAKSLEVSSVTIGRYLDLMVDLLLVRRLKPFTFNLEKRLVRAPKVYVRDSGLTHALLNIPDINSLLGHPVIGGSWEGFVIENLLSVAPAHVQPYYYRTSNGAEIDLILGFSPSERWAIEIKRSSVPKLSRGFYTSCEDVKATHRFAVYGGRDTFPMPQGVTAMPLGALMERLMEVS